MKGLVIMVLLLLLLPWVGEAGDNPDVGAYLCPEPVLPFLCAPWVALAEPPVRFDCYVLLHCFRTGLTGVALRVEHTEDVLVLDSYDLSVFHPEATTLSGAPGSHDGWVIASPECVVPAAFPKDFIVVARLSYWWTGGLGTISIRDHPVEGGAVFDCIGLPDEFCVYSHLGVNREPPYGDFECEPYSCYSPVERSTWRTLKGLYR